MDNPIEAVRREVGEAVKAATSHIDEKIEAAKRAVKADLYREIAALFEARAKELEEGK